MKAFVLDRYGKKRALRLADVPSPELRDDEVSVEVHAAGVDLLDSKIRDGEFKLILPHHLPLILGHDVAGLVVRVARGCSNSSWEMRSMRGRMTFGSVRSPNSSPSRKLPWRSSPRVSRWKKPLLFPWYL